jgi:hypothetical protein
VRDVLVANGQKVKIKSNGNLIKQVQLFGAKLLIPKDSYSFKNLKSSALSLVNLILFSVINFLLTQNEMPT